MNGVDEYTLSQYLDESMEYQHICETADVIASDVQTRDTLLEMLKAHTLLKALGNEIMSEEVPAIMLETVRGNPKKKWHTLFYKKPLLRVAAVIALLLTGFASGRMGESGTDRTATIFPTIPIGLERTVNTVLENEKSGTAHSWSDRTGRISAQVTPVKTYRDAKGSFYRFYSIDLSQDGIDLQLIGIAYRKGKDNWQTQSVFSRDHINKI